MRLFSDMASAFSLLTVLPVRSAKAPTPRAVAWFPWVGAFLGGVTWLALWGLQALNDALLQRGSLIAAVLIVLGWAAFSRLLHWDGLADVGDAWWGGATPERRREIMSDSHVGAFGVTAVVLVAGLQVAAMSTLLGAGSDLLWLAVVPVFARLAPVFAAWLGTPARTTGLGASVMGRPRGVSVLIAAIAPLAAMELLWWQSGVGGVPLAAGIVFVAVAIPHLIAGRMGGVTGDVMGASVTLTETFALLTFAIYAIW